MAIFHLRMQVIGRSSGQSAVAAAAYRSGDKLADERLEVTHDYSRKAGIYHSEILLPEGAPKRLLDRATLWNEVEWAEKRKNSQLAREFNIALPVELDAEAQTELLRGYVQAEFVDKGMCADISLHELESHNPHAHVMLTLREVDSEGFTVKNRDWNSWNDSTQMNQWREAWEVRTNAALEDAGSGERIDHRTLEAQGIDREPGWHLGKAAAMLRNNKNSWITDKQAEIDRDNAFKIGYGLLGGSDEDAELEERIAWQRERAYQPDPGSEWADWRDYAAERDWRQRNREQEHGGLELS